MEFNIRKLDHKYVEVETGDNTTKLNLGVMDKEEAFYVADVLLQAGIDLMNIARELKTE